MHKIFVFVAEDDKKLNQLVCESLEKEGFQAAPAYSAKEAVEKIKKHKYDLAILDWIFEGEELDGLDLIQQIKQKNKKTPVIILSGLTTLADKARGFEHEADDYVPKPFYLPELIMRVKALLRITGKSK